MDRAQEPMHIPVEPVEIDDPVRVLRYELVQDAAGSVHTRGGLGLRRECEMLAESSTVNIRGDRANCAPAGSFGGHDGSFRKFLLEDDAGNCNAVPSQTSGTLKRGQHLIITTPGGAGFDMPATLIRPSSANSLCTAGSRATSSSLQFIPDTATAAALIQMPLLDELAQVLLQCISTHPSALYGFGHRDASMLPGKFNDAR